MFPLVLESSGKNCVFLLLYPLRKGLFKTRGTEYLFGDKISPYGGIWEHL